MIYISK